MPANTAAVSDRHALPPEFAAERTRLIDRAQRSHQLHDLPSAAVCTDRHAAADDLAIGHQIRCDTKVSDSTVQLQTKSGNDFVKNQQSTVLVTDLTDSRAGIPFPGTTTPILAATGSTITQAISFGYC